MLKVTCSHQGVRSSYFFEVVRIGYGLSAKTALQTPLWRHTSYTRAARASRQSAEERLGKESSGAIELADFSKRQVVPNLSVTEWML